MSKWLLAALGRAMRRASAALATVALLGSLAAAGDLSLWPASATAQTLTANCWSTALLPQDGGSACFSSAYQACYRQFQEFAFTGIGPFLGVVDNGARYSKACSWVWHVGDSLPSGIFWHCANGATPTNGVCPGPGDNLKEKSSTSSAGRCRRTR